MSTIKEVFEAGKGILQLTPTWVPRGFNEPGHRLRLHPDDYYAFDQESYELKGELTKKTYHLGQKVRVRVADADALKRTVDFTVIE